MTYRLKVNQQWKIVAALIAIPVFFVLLYTGLILTVRDIPMWGILTSVVFILLASLGATLFVVFRWLTVDCEITLSEKHLHFKLLRETPFMQIHEFTSNWENIKNASLNEDHQYNAIYYTLQFRQTAPSLHLTDIPKQEIGDGSGSAFWKDLSRHIEQYNSGQHAPELRILNIGFYERPWARVFSYFILVFYVLAMVASVFSGDSRAWLRAVAFSAFALPWLLNYYRAKQKKNKNLPS